MCLIVYKENSNGVFTNRQFRSMIHRNADGLGIMWREDGRVKFDKVLGTPKDKFELFRKYRSMESWAMHARMKTHGKIDLDNCHPYELMSIDRGDAIDLFVMHNGVLSSAPEVNKDMSDTWHFMEYIIKPIVTANLDLLWNDDHFQTWLASTIKGSKLLFMRSDDVEHPVLILNHDAGKEESGCWLSNTYSTQPIVENKAKGGNAFETDPFMGRQATVTMGTPKMTGTSTGTISYVAAPERKSDANIEEYLVLLNGLSVPVVKDFVIDDPDIVADIMHYWYEERNLPYESIIEQIKDKSTVDGIVDIVRHIVSSYNV
jgi:hypothetical protein